MRITVNSTLTLALTSCCVCGVEFGMPEHLFNNRREKGGKFYCPNGHELVFTPSQVQDLQRRLDRSTERNQMLRNELDASVRSNRALRGQNTKLRNRLADGEAPDA